MTFQKIQKEIQGLTSAKPPQYTIAISRLDALNVPQDLAPEPMQRAANLRAQIVEQFWKYTQTEAEGAMGRDDENRAEDLVNGFLQVPPPNPFSERAETLRNQLPEIRVGNAVKIAKGLLAEGKAAEAGERLNGARLDLGKAASETRREWYQVAARVKYKQGKWPDAIEILSDPDLSGEPWAPTERNAVWDEWAKELEKKVVEVLLPNGKAEEALREVSTFLILAKSCPATARRQIEDLARDKIPPVAFKQELDHATTTASEALKLDPGVLLPPEKRADLEQALNILLPLRGCNEGADQATGRGMAKRSGAHPSKAGPSPQGRGFS